LLEAEYRVVVPDLQGGCLMRVLTGFGLLILLGGLSASAQTAPAPENSNTIHPGAMNTICESRLLPNDGKQAKGSSETTCVNVFIPGCPIDMHVRQGIGGGMIAVDDNGVKRRDFAQRLRLFLKDLQSGKSGQRIVSAIVTVHGLNGKARWVPLADGPGENGSLTSGNMARTLAVSMGDWGDPGVSGDFRLPGFTSIRSVDLQSVTYDDGSTWRVSAGQTCRVVPDSLMLVGN
jgi:hypothetical protein